MPMVAPVELVRELLQYRDMKMVSGRDWAFITAMLAGGSIALPLLAPFALGSAVLLVIGKLRELGRRRGIAGIDLPPPRVPTGATTIVGTPRRFRTTVPSLVDDTPVLLQHAMVRDRAGGVLIRRSAGAAFLLERADDDPVLVAGVARLTAPGLFGRSPVREHIRRGDRLLTRMGVPADLAIAGDLEIGTLVEDELVVSVTGILDEESVAELAFHRDGGRIAVMRGHAGSPVLVEDRRLIAAALVR